MYTTSQYFRGARRRLAQAINPKVRSNTDTGYIYYPQQSSCQIPNLWMLYKLFLGEREHGFFIEVGAYDGLFVSNTWGLAERKWSGIMVEPIPFLAAACRENHKSHPSIEVLEVAAGTLDDDTVVLHLAGTLTTANATVFAEYADVPWAKQALTSDFVEVESQTLNSICQSKGVPIGFDVLVVDVEGFEAQVFEGFSISNWSPKMIIVELADTHPDLNATRKTDANLGSYIADLGYRIVFKDYINTVFVRQDIWEHAVCE